MVMSPQVRYMNILYVNAGNAGSLGLDSFLCAPPLALMYLTPTVPDHGKFLVDLKANPGVPERTMRYLIRKHDLIAISSYTPSICPAFDAVMAAFHALRPLHAMSSASIRII